MKDKIIAHIYESGDYDKFKTLKGNRAVKGLKMLLKSIEKIGLKLSPIAVNEKYEIIDGQHRFEIRRELGKPITYYFENGAGLEDCQYMNIGQTNWSTLDFIKSYAENGNESYQRLHSIIEEYKKCFTLESILFVANPRFINAAGGTSFNSIKSGQFNFSKDCADEAIETLDAFMELGYLDFKSKYDMPARQFWGAVAYAHIHPGVDFRRLIVKMNENPKAIIGCANVADQLSYFDDAYNRNLKPRYKVFMSSDIQKGMYFSESEE